MINNLFDIFDMHYRLTDLLLVLILYLSHQYLITLDKMNEVQKRKTNTKFETCVTNDVSSQYRSKGKIVSKINIFCSLQQVGIHFPVPDTQILFFHSSSPWMHSKSKGFLFRFCFQQIHGISVFSSCWEK